MNNNDQARLSQNQYIGLKKELFPKKKKGSSYLAYDTEELYIYNHLDRPVLVAGANIEGDIASPRAFLPASELSVDYMNVINESQVSEWNLSLANPKKDTIVFYTGNDDSSSIIKQVFHIDINGDVTPIYERKENSDYNRILSGHVEWSGSGLNFESTNITYVFNNEELICQSESFELNIPNSGDRIDVVAVNNEGELVIIEGVPSENPQEPTIDFETELRVTSIYLNEGESTPNGMYDDIIYDENLGSPNEWDEVSLVPQENIDLDSSDFPYSGTKHISAQNLVSGNEFNFRKNSTVNLEGISSFSFRMNSVGLKNKSIYVKLLNNGNGFHSFEIQPGTYGLNTIDSEDYQLITVPYSIFNPNNEAFDQVSIAFVQDTGEIISRIYIDKIRLVYGMENPVLSNTFLNLTDTPNSYTSFGEYDVVVKKDESGLEFIKRKTKLSEFENDEEFITAEDIPEDIDYVSISSLRSANGNIIDDKVVNVSGYHSAGDGGGGQFYWDKSSTEADNSSTVIKLNTVNIGRFKRIIKNTLDVRDFGARLNTESDQSSLIQSAIDFCGANNIKLIFSGSGSQTYYRIDNTITFNSRGLNVEFVGGAYIKPVNSSLLVAVVIGGVGVPSKMTLRKIKIDRGTYDGNTENIGFKFLECVQCTFSDFESRYSKYNTVSAPTFSAFAYNLFENLQNIGGYYNINLSATSPGYSNENKFIGGRCFATASLNTHVVLGEYETNHNTFVSMSTEGSGQQAWLVKGGSNVILYPRTEGTWVNGSIILDTTSAGNTVVSTRYDGDITDLNYPNGRNQIRSYYNGTQIITAVNGQSSIKAVRLGVSNGKPASYVHDIDSESGDDYVNEWMHARESDESYVFKSIRQVGNLVRAFLKTNGSMFLSRSLEIGQTAWNFKPLKIGIYHLWFEAGNLLIKTSAPTSALDGKFVQLSQSSVPAGFNTAGNSVNTVGKYLGKMVFDTSTNRPVFATGSSTTSTWNFADGTVAYTPS